MARKAGQGEEEEVARVMLQEEKKPAHHEEKMLSYWYFVIGPLANCKEWFGPRDRGFIGNGHDQKKRQGEFTAPSDAHNPVLLVAIGSSNTVPCQAAIGKQVTSSANSFPTRWMALLEDPIEHGIISPKRHPYLTDCPPAYLKYPFLFPSSSPGDQTSSMTTHFPPPSKLVIYFQIE
ncbi:hypothetical protein STEG23_021696, partial [Scotinomys teguina]